jgi:hypothetical protein
MAPPNIRPELAKEDLVGGLPDAANHLHGTQSE